MHQLFSTLAKYRLNELLVQIANIAREMAQNNEPTREIVVKVKKAGSVETHEIIMSAWGLLDLCYLAIRNTSDSAPYSPTADILNEIYFEYIEYDGEISSAAIPENSDLEKLYLYLFGLAQKSFWFQEYYRIREQFNREIELLEVIPAQVGTRIDINKIVLERTGYSIKSFRKLLLALFGMGLSNPKLDEISIDDGLIRYDPNLTKSNLKKVIELYSADYEEYCKSQLKQMFLYLKPIVRTSTREHIVVSQYLLAKKIADGPFWILRDYFVEKGKDESRNFTTEFGRYFEKYVENLLSHYLLPASFFKVPEEPKEKRADWIINTSRFQIIVEQKSSLMSIMLRDTAITKEQLEGYLAGLRTGLYQLRATAEAYKENGKIQVKLLLHYDLLFMAENILKDLILKIPPADLSSDYYFVYISDFEHLIQVLKEDEAAFDNIISHKLDAARPSSEGKEFWQIIRQYSDKGNLYTKSALNHFMTYLQS